MNSPLVFDRAQVRRQRRRAAATSGDHAFLFDWTMRNLTDRLSIIRRRFPRMLQQGARCTPALTEELAQAAGAQEIFVTDTSFPADNAFTKIISDEENLPFAPRSFDLVLSPLSLHTVNDLPGALIQLRRCLKPDGLFLGALPGGETLYQLRDSLMRAELELTGGVAPRVSPFAGKQEMGALMQRAGFALPVVDSEIITVTYPDLFRLFADLRGMGENNAVIARSRRPPPRALWSRAAAIYRRHLWRT